VTVALSATYTIATARSPGAIAIIQLHGDDVRVVLRKITGIDKWPVGQMKLVSIGGVDEGLVGRVNHHVAQLMPHGGPRVVQRLVSQLIELGAQPSTQIMNPSWLFPEALDDYEAIMLQTLATAASTLAIAPLLAQPAIWRSGLRPTDEDIVRSRRLSRLLNPPLVVVAGQPNVGKSTLINALAGRSVSISQDAPGTTRDYTAVQLDLGGVTVRWHDTPGLRETDDTIEARAITLAQRLLEQADCLLALADSEHDWPAWPREPDLRVGTKADLAYRDDADLCVSAMTGDGQVTLVEQIRDTLVSPADIAAAMHRPWVFDERLMEM